MRRDRSPDGSIVSATVGYDCPQDWRRNKDGCVDLWIQWSEAEDTMDVRLEHWGIRQLAERYCDASLVGAVDVALLGPADMASRVDVIARILEQSLAAAGSQ